MIKSLFTKGCLTVVMMFEIIEDIVKRLKELVCVVDNGR